MNADYFQKLGRDSIIKIATERIRSSFPTEFNPTDFQIIKALRREDMVFVVFNTPIRFIPSEGSYIYSISVTLTDNALSYSELSSSEKDRKKDSKFFKPTKESDKAIDFVFDCINKSTEIGHVKREEWPVYTTMTIWDKGSYYEIEVTDEHTDSEYKINKSNGEIYDASHRHLAPDPHENNEIEILN
jgi:hypothetical protein